MPPFLRRRWLDYCFRRTVRRFFRRREKFDTAVAVRPKGILRRLPRYTRKIPQLQGYAEFCYWRDTGEKLHEIARQYPQKSVEWLPDEEAKDNSIRLNLAHLGGRVFPPAPRILRRRYRYTRRIPVLQGDQLVAALLAFERDLELLSHDEDEDEEKETVEESESKTVAEAFIVPDAEKLESVQEEEEEIQEPEAVDNESVGKDEAFEDKGAIEEDEYVEEEQAFDNEAVEEEQDVTVLPIKIKKTIQPPKAPLRRSPRLGGAMGSVFIASETGRVVRRSARTMSKHPSHPF